MANLSTVNGFYVFLWSSSRTNHTIAIHGPYRLQKGVFP